MNFNIGSHEINSEVEKILPDRAPIVFLALPYDTAPVDYTQYSRFTVIVRLNYGYDGKGNIPPVSMYEDYAKRCAEFINGSKGVDYWQIGNECLQLEWEWPNGIRPSLDDYVKLYLLVRSQTSATTSITLEC